MKRERGHLVQSEELEAGDSNKDVLIGWGERGICYERGVLRLVGGFGCLWHFLDDIKLLG